MPSRARWVVLSAALVVLTAQADARASAAPRERATLDPAPDTVRAPAAVLTTWFDHIRRDELDSLRPLLTPDFLFVSDGSRMGPDAFVAMIKGLGISHPHVRLSNIVTHRAGNFAYLVYDRTESFEWHGRTRTVPETGALVVVRRGSRWLIVQWAATSPPS